MGTNSTKLKRLAENSAIKDCIIPILICDSELVVCFANNSAEQLSEEFTAGCSMRQLIPPSVTEQLDQLSTRCLVMPITPYGNYTSAAVLLGNVSKTQYYAIVFRSHPLLPPQSSPWYVHKNFSYLAESMDKLMSHNYKTDKSIIKYMAQLTRFCSYLFNKPASLPDSTNVNELLSVIVNELTPILSTIGVSAELEYDDRLYTTLDSPLIPAGNLMVAMILTMVLFSETGRIKIYRTQVEGTGLLELSTKTRVGKKARDAIHSFTDLLSYAAPICVELAALKDQADTNGLHFDLRYDDEDLVLYYRTNGKLSSSIEMRAPDILKDVSSHFATLSASLFELVKTSIYKKEL